MRISRARVGELEVFGIADARPAPVDPMCSYPEVPRAAWAPHRRWLTEDGQFQPDLGCFLVRSPDGVVLIDAGIGPGPVPYLGDARGTLRESFGELGLTFGDVSAVIFTHLHFDHVGWASVPDASGTMQPSFPRARYFVGETEWMFWDRGPVNVMAHHIDAFARIVRPIAEAGLLTVVPDESALIDGFVYCRLPGNTPGHQGVLAISNGQRCLFCADICHCPAQVTEPLWSHRSDVDPAIGRATRQAIFSELADTPTLLAFGHFPRGADLGHVSRAGSGWAWRPLAGD
ncbi:MAG: MBL fold metallo-hydrolase [Alphaproteobacteria bacterium]|nr:MBL fold metallo-hydrolase [Alphaproteobacteria bacterium]